MMAAIEIYNKPQITYRDECFSILLINAWELLLKAILSKNKDRIFYPKKKNEDYKTLSLQHALLKTQKYFPASIPYQPVANNITTLEQFRDKTVHYYNQPEFAVLIYGLAQTSIINYKDLLFEIFGKDISKEMTLSLLPLSFGIQPDPIVFLQKAKSDPPKSKAVAEFIDNISWIINDLESKKIDTARLLTVYKISLESVKKVSASDITAGIDSTTTTANTIYRKSDPNISHPLTAKGLVAEIGASLNGVKFTVYTLQVIVWKYKIKDKNNFYWHSTLGGVGHYSRDTITFLKGLSKSDIETALTEYRQRPKSTTKRKPTRRTTN